MDALTIHRLKKLNDAFYEENHATFSQTRSHAWDGWVRLLGCMQNAPSSVLDVACGNMRFKAFLDESIGASPSYYGVDSCAALAPDGLRGSFQELDCIDELENGTLAQSISAPACDLTVCFGFLHHVPSRPLRASLMRTLAGMALEGGTIAVSFWQFANDELFRAKAHETTGKVLQSIAVELEEGDYLLGWQNKADAYRYCHSFSDGEVMQLVEACGGNVELIDRYKADGKTGNMNAYVVLRKLSSHKPV